jgi:DNA-binding transcriptional LysR family regulator
VRQTRSVALTDVGRRFLEEARATLRQADQAELIGAAARGKIGSVAVAYVLSAAFAGLSSSIQFKAAHPTSPFSSPRWRRSCR